MKAMILAAGFGTSGVVTTNIGANNHEVRVMVTDGTNLYIGGYDQTIGGSNSQWRVEKRLMSTGAMSWNTSMKMSRSGIRSPSRRP